MASVSAETAPRQRHLDATIELMSREGSSGWTLRRLAEAIGTSHRMVIYHFGSLDGLLLAVVEEAERHHRERRVGLAALHPEPIEAARAMWQEFASPTAAPHERLFFELYTLGLQGRGPAASLPRASIEESLKPLTRLHRTDEEKAP